MSTRLMYGDVGIHVGRVGIPVCLQNCTGAMYVCVNVCACICIYAYRADSACIHSKNRLVETTKKLVDMCLTKLLVKITNPSLVKFTTNHK